METGEAIMGVTKTLMASNDTLFNFEDTLGDRDDMFSPRTPHSGTNTCTATTPQPIECITPTNDYSVQEVTIFTSTGNVVIPNMQASDNMDTVKPILKPFDFVNLVSNDEYPSNAPNDLLSPEQAKTFSEEINSIEQSSDLSGTVEATTNTLDDLKTCISVHLKTDDDKDDDDDDFSDWAESSISLVQAENVLPDDTNSTSVPQPIHDQNAQSPENGSANNSQYSQEVEAPSENTQNERNSDASLLSNQIMYPLSLSISTLSSSAPSDSSPSSSTCDQSPAETPANENIERCNENGNNMNGHQNGNNNDDKYRGELSNKENTLDFLTKEIEYASSQKYLSKKSNEPTEYYKENKDPNSKQVKAIHKHTTAIVEGQESSGTKVQNNSQATVILNADVLNGSDHTRRIHEPHFVSKIFAFFRS